MTLPSELLALRDQLAPHVRAVGFEIVEASLQGQDPWWLEYRRVDLDGTIVLCLSAATEPPTITAELWRPSELPQARRVTRVCNTASDQSAVIADISRTVARWLDELGGTSPNESSDIIR